MLISKKHLGALVPLDDITSIDLEHQLSCFGGLEVEGITPLIEDRGYIIGYIETLEQHPDADKLSVCTVNTGSEVLQIVCGASNARAGAYVIVAPVGTELPDGLVIASRAVRGVASNGMLCALQEIGLDEKFVEPQYKDGIYLFENQEVTVGANAVEALGFNTDIFDLDITPNRADCLNYRGIAYETAALLSKSIDASLFEKVQKLGTVDITKYVASIEIPSPKVLDYQLLVFEDVEVRPSPQWMQSFLIASGIRPISNIVDITNYVMLYLGQPLHAFDAKKIDNPNFVIRQAFAGEQLETLDLQVRTLTTDDIVIATTEKAIALAGVMGGSSTAIDADTTNIVIEAAIFDPVSVRKTAAKFNLRSDASQRFEKGVDPALPKLALALTTELLVKYANAKVANTIVGATLHDPVLQEIMLTHTYIQEQLGVAIDEEVATAFLERLGFEVTVSAGVFTVTVPSRRTGIIIKQDIIEEIVRLYGYENIPLALPTDIGRPVFIEARDQFAKDVRDKMMAQGLNEILTYTLTSAEKAVVGQTDPTIIPYTIQYPLNAERSTLRTTAYVQMIDTLQYHKNRHFDGLAFYEITNLYTEQAHRQVLSIGGFGTIIEQKVYNNTAQVDFYTMKFWVESVVDAGHRAQLSYTESTNALFHPGISADVHLADKYIGTFGKIHPLAARKLDVSEDLYIGELSLDVLFETIGNVAVHYVPVNVLPSISRDFSFMLHKDMQIGTLLSAIKTNAGEDFATVELVDIYEDSRLGDEKSVTVNVTYTNKEKTLTNEHVDLQVTTMLYAVAAACGATTRG